MDNDITVAIVNITIFTQNYCFIWFDFDSFLLNGDKMLVFRSSDDAQNYCIHEYNQKIDVWNLNFDEIIFSDSSLFLDRWNVVGDIAKTLNLDFIGNHDDYTYLYSKFVYGSNIPALNTS
ncbi:MAG: hypothetical protein J5505_07405, partial [Spirochaetaceae bacterium]|nr:hypothetical protein [Spirochaetaceae bacterium]